MSKVYTIECMTNPCNHEVFIMVSYIFADNVVATCRGICYSYFITFYFSRFPKPNVEFQFIFVCCWFRNMIYKLKSLLYGLAVELWSPYLLLLLQLTASFHFPQLCFFMHMIMEHISSKIFHILYYVVKKEWNIDWHLFLDFVLPGFVRPWISGASGYCPLLCIGRWTGWLIAVWWL